jgi:hypothetical protein
MVSRLPCLLLACLCACAGTEGRVLWEEPGDATVTTEDAATAGPVDAGVLVLTLSGETPTDVHGGDGGTEEHSDVCPEDQALIGYRGTIESNVFTSEDGAVPVIGSLEGVCAKLAVAPSGRVSTSEAGLLPKRGRAESEPWEQRCAADEIIVAFSGSSGVALDRVKFACSAWSVRESAGLLSLERGPLHGLEQAGGPGGGEFSDGCPAGQLARGSFTRSGALIDAAGLVCGTPSFVRE